jgi:hypothetical protein
VSSEPDTARLQFQLALCVFEIDEARPFAGQRGIQLHDLVEEIRRLAQRRPQDAVIEHLGHAIVVTDRCGQGRFAEAAGATQGRGDRRRARRFTSSQQRDEFLRLAGTFDESAWQRRRHEWHARDVAAATQVGDQLLPLGVWIVEVRLPHPRWQARVIQSGIANTFDWIDAHPALARAPPLPAGILGAHRRGGHDQHQELSAIELLLDLLPPADPAFQFQSIEPGRNIRSVGGQAGLKRSGERFAVLSRVRDECPVPGPFDASHPWHCALNSVRRRQERSA